VLSIGGDFMAGRFLVAPFAVSLCMLARQRPPPAIALAALPLIAGIAFAGHWRTEAFGGVPRTAVIELVDGIANERAFYGPGMSLRGVLADGGGPRNGWRVIGTGLRDDRAPLSLAGNVGLLGYYAGPGVHIVDVFGLTDPLTARLAVRNPAARIGHFGREPPSGYMRSLETGTNAIVQPDLARYYAALRNVVSGPLASSARVADVVSVNAGAARAALAAFERKGDAPQRADALTLADGAGDAQACAKCLYLSSAGVVVGFADAVRPATLEVTLDRAGRYEVQWQLQGSAVATEIIEATSAANAMGTVTVGAQRGAVRYDTVRLRPLDGYGGYRLAALRAVGS
jgi:hypothetical protein